MRRTVLLVASTALAMVLVCGDAWADTFTVKNTKDSGPGSLRTAIANANPGRNLITFAPGVRGEIRLKEKLPTLAGELEIRGPGAGRLVARRAVANDFRIFTVGRGSSVRISGLTISNGLAEGPGPCCNEGDVGGGVFNEGTLTLRDVVVSANTADVAGGGIYNGGTLTVEGGALSSNRTAFNGTTSSDGGGIYNAGTLTVRSGAFSSNRAVYSGGAISNRGDATVTDTTFSENSSQVDTGGAINNSGPAPSRAARLTVRNGSFTGNTAREGGAIDDTYGEVAIVGSTFSGNTATNGGGGGINGFRDTVRVTDSTFSDNTARQSGGAIRQDRGGTLTVEGTTFTANTAREHNGGAIRGYRNTVRVTDSTFSENIAREDGGGINLSDDGILEVEDSTFLANRATEEGGGIFAFRGTMKVSNSTFTRNAAAHGGGLYNYGVLTSELIVESSTFANNEASKSGGGIYSDSGQEDIATLYPGATIVAGNEAPDGPNVFGPVTSRGYNLIGDPSGSTGFGGTDLTNTRAGLDPQGLKDNGGPTRTIALVRSSRAVDAVAEGCPPPTTDQRGVSRPQNGDGEGAALCDIGAFERQAP